jgi:L-alanine-DL-glutamate epimerase-like enolase superfamily enzyme
MALPPDLDPRGRFLPDLADPRLPGADGLVPVPTGPGTGVTPDPEVLRDALVVRSLAP